MQLSDLKSQYSKKELWRGPAREKYGVVEEYYGKGHEPHTNYFYAFLGMVYDGINTIQAIKKEMMHIFISSTHQLVVEPQDVEEYLQSAKKKGFVKVKAEGIIELTKQGREFTELCYFINLHTTHWMRIFLSEKSVMIGTAIFLIILSILKILTGIQLGSQGMLNEGFENLTDLIKIGIIAILSLRLKKDRLASIIIIGLMLFTGFTLIWSGIDALLNPTEITPTIQAYIIGFLSITLNGALMYLKSLVGRSSGNLSILSDSKDSQVNIYISTGVLIGFTFAIFKYYFVDAIVGIIIAIIIFKEGIEILREVATNEEDFDITQIKVAADNLYDNRLTGYLLANIRRGQSNQQILISNFKKGLEQGRRYYEGFADFFYDELGKSIAEKHLYTLIKAGYIEKLGEELILTNEGLKFFYKAKAKEFKNRAKDIYAGADIRRGQIYCFLFILCIIFLFIFAEPINNWLAGF